MVKTAQRVEVEGQELIVTNWDRILWPEDGFTKGDLIRYYAAAASFLLPYLQDRLLTVTRYPGGITGKFFYQKNCPDYAPEFIQTLAMEGDTPEKPIRYILPQDRPTLVWLANQACIELHPSHARIANLDYPDWIVFDLDPAEGCDFDDAREIAFLVKKTLEGLKLEGYPKLSGASGIHIYVPIEARYTHKTITGFAGRIGEILTRVYPEKVTNERLVKNRTGHIYIDHLQNLPGKTIVAPYSPRPLPGAPISSPVTWEELETVHPDQFHLGNILTRLEQAGDVFAPVIRQPQSLDAVLTELGVLATEEDSTFKH